MIKLPLLVGDLAGSLGSLLADSRSSFLAVECTPRVSTWHHSLPSSAANKLIEFTPAWFVHLMEKQHGFSTSSALPWQRLGALTAGAKDVDRIVEDTERLNSVFRFRRIRRIDTAASGLCQCNVLSIGSGEEVNRLLSGAGKFISQHRPVVLLDLGVSELDDSTSATILPSYSFLKGEDDSRMNGSYVVAVPVEKAPSLGCLDNVAAVPTLTGPIRIACFRGNELRTDEGAAYWVMERSGFAAWLDGHALRSSLAFKLGSVPPYGFRIFLNGKRADFEISQEQELKVRIPQSSNPLLLEIKPIRWSTVDRIQPITIKYVVA